jgi:Mrp family chromosome partitioning ATPase
MAGLLEMVQEIPFRTPTDSLLIDAARPHEAPMEEFRTLRTRLNHMKTLQPIHTVVITSPSPAEGKSLSAANLALAQSHLAGNTTLLADFDFRRPIVHTLFGIDRSPGITDYLLGKVELHQAIRKVAGTELYIMPAGVGYAGEAPGFVGLNQINIEIREGTPTGSAVPVSVRSENRRSNEVTLAIE